MSTSQEKTLKRQTDDDKTLPLFEFDKKLCGSLGAGAYLAGTDEVGRGPLAGPVVVAAVIMPLDEMIPGIFDSKQVSEKKRDELYPVIIKKAVAYNIAAVENDVIDEINILEATKLCMKKAIEGLKITPALVAVDAVRGLNTVIKTLPIIKGDENSYNIAAASIVAKVYRDNLMREYDKKYPEYGFARNKGYGSLEHIEAIKKYGAVSIHRSTFIRNFSVKEGLDEN